MLYLFTIKIDDNHKYNDSNGNNIIYMAISCKPRGIQISFLKDNFDKWIFFLLIMIRVQSIYLCISCKYKMIQLWE